MNLRNLVEQMEREEFGAGAKALVGRALRTSFPGSVTRHTTAPSLAISALVAEKLDQLYVDDEFWKLVHEDAPAEKLVQHVRANRGLHLPNIPAHIWREMPGSADYRARFFAVLQHSPKVLPIDANEAVKEITSRSLKDLIVPYLMLRPGDGNYLRRFRLESETLKSLMKAARALEINAKACLHSEAEPIRPLRTRGRPADPERRKRIEEMIQILRKLPQETDFQIAKRAFPNVKNLVAGAEETKEAAHARRLAAYRDGISVKFHHDQRILGGRVYGRKPRRTAS